MGYTHYYGGKVVLNDAILSEVREIIAKAETQGIEIKGGLGTGAPIISTEEILLNGTAEGDLDHETFAVFADQDSRLFCKTARKPYDAVVGAILLRLAEENPTFSVSSDGDWSEDWEEPRALFADVFGHDAPKPGDIQD